MSSLSPLTAHRCFTTSVWPSWLATMRQEKPNCSHTRRRQTQPTNAPPKLASTHAHSQPSSKTRAHLPGPAGVPHAPQQRTPHTSSHARHLPHPCTPSCTSRHAGAQPHSSSTPQTHTVACSIHNTFHTFARVHTAPTCSNTSTFKSSLCASTHMHIYPTLVIKHIHMHQYTAARPSS